MKSFLIIATSALLLFNGIGALYGGWSFISRPDGSGMKMSVDLLKNSPFQNYLIPGIILFFANGVFSLVVLAALWLRYGYSGSLIMIQGTILTGWILIQILMIRTIIPLHWIMGAIGLALFVSGWTLMKMNLIESKNHGV